MKGATEYYNTIQKAYYRKLSNLRNLNLRHGWNGGNSEAYIYDNFIFVTSTHARGECFRIYLIEDATLPDEVLKSKAFEVYGIISGQPGWTECYGWKHKGSWVKPILKYLMDLKKEIELYDESILEEKRLKEKEKNKIIGLKVDKFNQMFA